MAFQIAGVGSKPTVYTGKHLFRTGGEAAERGRNTATDEENIGCETTYTSTGFYDNKRKRTASHESGHHTEDSAGSVFSSKTGSHQDEDRSTKPGWSFLQSIQAKEKLNVAPTALELSDMCTDLYVSSIEMLQYFLPWKYRFIALAQKEPRLRENILENARTIVDLNTNNWNFEKIGRHVFKHNTTFPEYPCWFSCNGNVSNDYYNLCTSLMIYMTFVIQNNLCAPICNNFNGEVGANVSNAYNYIHWVKDFLDNTHNSKKHVLAFYRPPSVGKTRIFTKPLLSFMRSNCILGPPGRNPDFYFSLIVGKRCVLLEEFTLCNLEPEQLLTWFGATAIEVPVKHKKNKKLEKMPILMNGNVKPAFMYERRFSERINENYIGWSDYNGKIKKEIYPLAIWLAT